MLTNAEARRLQNQAQEEERLAFKASQISLKQYIDNNEPVWICTTATPSSFDWVLAPNCDDAHLCAVRAAKRSDWWKADLNLPPGCKVFASNWRNFSYQFGVTRVILFDPKDVMHSVHYQLLCQMIKSH